MHDGLYILSPANSSFQALSAEVSSLEIWHQRLAHTSSSVLQHFISSNQLECKSNRLDVCDSCSRAKSHRQSFSTSSTVANKPLEIVHYDLWGPSPIVSHNGYRYYVMFTDQFSRFNWIYSVRIKVKCHLCFFNSNCWLKIYSLRLSRLYNWMEELNFYPLFDQILKFNFTFPVLTLRSRMA